MEIYIMHPSPLEILFFVQHDYHQLHKICSWSASFGYIEHLYIHKLYFMSYYISNEIFCSYLLYNKENSVPHVIIYCKFTQKKEYVYMIIHNSYL